LDGVKDSFIGERRESEMKREKEIKEEIKRNRK
jgi:hypothetical protein